MTARKRWPVTRRMIVGIVLSGIVTLLLVFASSPISESEIVSIHFPPEVATEKVTYITKTTATLYGELEDLGDLLKERYLKKKQPLFVGSLSDYEMNFIHPLIFGWLIRLKMPITDYDYFIWPEGDPADSFPKNVIEQFDILIYFSQKNDSRLPGEKTIRDVLAKHFNAGILPAKKLRFSKGMIGKMVEAFGDFSLIGKFRLTKDFYIFVYERTQ